MPTVRRSLWSLWLVWIVCLGLSIGGYALAASGLADKGMERLAQAWDVVSQAMKVTLATTLAGEDVANDVLKVEQRFAPINVSADTLVKSGPGQLHLMTCSSDATATAGSIILYDNTAESGTVLHTFTVAASYYQPFTIWFDVAFSVGLYVGYTTTADVNCTVSYR